ncbi:hypothetical protein DEO72_LG6g1958 [Vigna unguiculata]|uniref:Uncharacterized protein n=1 Tax=Vigna unguiculata TaxID=3917 RepID=A0A4D6MA25_VIGUN|nr:hypothetical protein DEO72_LG6g1958 [Vigna unguiculata]
MVGALRLKSKERSMSFTLKRDQRKYNGNKSRELESLSRDNFYNSRGKGSCCHKNDWYGEGNDLDQCEQGRNRPLGKPRGRDEKVSIEDLDAKLEKSCFYQKEKITWSENF